MPLKNEILTLLEKSRGGSVSGQYLSDTLGVSRNAVWKAVNSLRDEGYDISSSTNKGYSLGGDMLSECGIRLGLDVKYGCMKISVLRETDSTNNEAKRLIAAGLDENVLIAADSQTSGRGRRGRSFYSPSGTGIYMTLVIRADVPMADAVSITTMAAVAVSRAIERVTGEKTGIKWVNDIYLGGRKVCGILTEAVSDFESGTTQNIIVGIGINVSTDSFPDDVAAVACSLGNSAATRNEIIAAVANEVFKLAEDLTDRSYMDEYRDRSVVIGKEITVYKGDEARRAEAVSVDDDGGLVIRLPDGAEETLRSGEITVRFA